MAASVRSGGSVWGGIAEPALSSPRRCEPLHRRSWPGPTARATGRRPEIPCSTTPDACAWRKTPFAPEAFEMTAVLQQHPVRSSWPTSSTAPPESATPASVSLAHCLSRKTQGFPMAPLPSSTPSSPVSRIRPTASDMDLRSPLPRINVGRSRANSTARWMASQSRAPCTSVSTSGRAGRWPQAVHPTTPGSTVHLDLVVSNPGLDRERDRPRVPGCTRRGSCGEPTPPRRAPSPRPPALTGGPVLDPPARRRMMVTASSGLRMRPAPHPLLATSWPGIPC